MRTEPCITHAVQAATYARALRLLSLMALLSVLCSTTGCMTSFREYVRNGFKVGPNYCPPQVPVADHWIDYEKSAISSEPQIDWAWWRLFRDPTLDDLVQTAHRQNISLREAGYRIEEARALRAISIGNLFPQQQTASGFISRRMLSLGSGVQAGGGGGIPNASRYFNVYNMGTQLAWELDFWGRYRRAIESADAALDSSVENFDNVLVILIGDVAEAYVEIRTVEQRLEYARQNVASQRGSLDLAEKKRAGGAGSRLDVTQAITNVAQTEALIPQLEIQLRQAQNRLCVLMGLPPQNIEPMLARYKGIPTAPAEIALGIPADLVRRRPDVRQTEREVAVQSARIGIAETNLYPAFTINGQIFVQATQFQNLFDARSVGGAFGPSFNWNILNYGRLRNNVNAEEARFMQRVATYQNTVLNAHREVEDGIVVYLRSQERTRSLRAGTDAAKESRDLVNELYQGGKADFNRVFVAELFLQQQQDLLAQAEGDIAQGLVQVYRALGGGWEIRDKELPPMTDVRPDVPVEEIDPPEAGAKRRPMVERLPPAEEDEKPE
jgi:NodT family efflux transporter outer membrane factor (OMF) lipoprotein